MLKPSCFKATFVFACLLMGLYACQDKPSALINKKAARADSLQTEQLINEGMRAENADNDSLRIISQQLYHLNLASGNKTALVYAGVFQATYLWQAASHKSAMAAAIKCLATADKYKVNRALPQIYGIIANLHKETTNYNMAFDAANQGLAASINNKDTASVIALLGLKAMFTRGLTLNRQQGSLPDKSIELNLAALSMAEKSPKYERLRTRFYDNIAQYYKDMRDLNKAFYYANKGVANAVKFNQRRSLTYAYCWLGQAAYYKGNQAEGIMYLDKAMQIAQELKEPYRVMEIYGAKYDCFFSSADYERALKSYTRYRNMRDSLKVLDNVKQISDLQLKYETAQKDKQISGLNANAKIMALQRYAIIVVLILLVVISVLIYIKEKKSRDLLLSEKLRVDEALKNAALELLYYTENLKQKNELIEEFKAEVEHLQMQYITTSDKENLEKLIQAHIMTNENWDNFKRIFSKVHTNFFAVLRQNFPGLTATDTRILSLIKMQLSNNEMANMLGITIEGIKKSKQRLRKKMGLDKEETLENVVAAL